MRKWKDDTVRAIFVRLALVIAVVGVAQMLFVSTALAHTGEDASTGHVIVEFGRWGLGVGAVLAVIILVFWIRARVWPQ